MADFVYNIAKGRVAEFYNRVQANDPGTSVLTLVVIDTSATDATLIDLDNLSLVLADVNTAEVTNTNYARIDLADTDLSALSPNDGNDSMDLDFADQTWTTITAGDGWTDLIVCYNPTGGADTTLIPLTHHDFIITPDGSDITAQLNAAGFYRAQ